MISIECFKGFPLDYEPFLIEKYSSFLTTCRYVEIYYPSCDINYMLVTENNILIELLLFGNSGNTSYCFNSLVKIDKNIVSSCIGKLFEIYPDIKKIKIDASYNEYLFEKSVLQKKSNDYILNLPSTFDEYNSELGSKTRKHLRQRTEKLNREFLNVRFSIKFGSEIQEDVLETIFQFNYNRMKIKGNVPGINEGNKNKMYSYSMHYGGVALLELEGEIVAGCVFTLLKKHIYLHVVAHDNKFSRYNVGEVCVFSLLQTCIEKQISIVHFLWGESELKRRLLAKSHLLFSYCIYRNNTLDYGFSKVGKVFNDIWYDFRCSEISIPLKNAVKYSRRKLWKV